MGEPGVPGDGAQREAYVLAERILDAIRNDESVTCAVIDTTYVIPVAAVERLERALWLLASTIVERVDPAELGLTRPSSSPRSR